MPHPIPPPEPPAIVQTLPADSLDPVSTSVTATESLIAEPTSTTRLKQALQQSQETVSATTSPDEKPTPEPSPLNAARSAELLGRPVSIGYPIESVETISSSDSNAASAVPPLSQPLPVEDVNTDSAIATPQANVLQTPTPKAYLTDNQVVAPQRRTSKQIQPFQTKAPPSLPSSIPSSSIKKILLERLSSKQSSTNSPKQLLLSQESPQVQEDVTTEELPNFQRREFIFQAPAVAPTETPPINAQQPTTQPASSPLPTQLPTTPQQEQPAPAPVPTQPQTQPPGTAPARERIIEVTSDRQEYDEQRQIVTAEGNVLLRFDGGVLDADRLQVNLTNLIAVGEGNVALTRGSQVLRGERFTYNFLQDKGDLANGSGEIFIPSAGTDFDFNLATDVTAGAALARPPSDRTRVDQPLQQVTSPGGAVFSFGSSRNTTGVALPRRGGEVKRLRFQAEQINFYPEGWQANNVRITNDPFSPPELEIRANTVTLTRETPFRDRIKTTRQRLVFDQRLSLPIPRDQAVIDRRERPVNPGLAQIGYDEGDRGGVFVERSFTPINTEQVQLSLTPQFFIQKAIAENGGNIFDPSLYGLRARLDATLGSRTSLRGSAAFRTLELSDIENRLRASLRLRQKVDIVLPHTLTLEYSYRDRLFNGSLGFQTVRSSLGGVLTSPVIPLGKTGINLTYQAGAQYVTADTDRLDLLEPIRENNRVSLSRVQGNFALSRAFLVWLGKPLPATATEGLKYTATPVLPYVALIGGLLGGGGLYSNGDTQTTLTGTVGVVGQFGNFSRPFFDYTSVTLIYSQALRSGTSPFLFDRAADVSVLSAGLVQQIYGPFRIGIQTILNLDTGDEISTDYILEYSRRTYGITLRYNPIQELGSLNLRISDFNWVGGSDPFSEPELGSVINGVQRENE